MTKYEIRTDHFEFRFGKTRDSIPDATEDEIFAWYMEESSADPTIRESCDSLDSAQEIFRRDYAGYGVTRAEKSMVWWLLVGELAWIEENEYDEYGDFVCGGECYDISAEEYVNRN